jgi:hypothetical protein
MYLQKVISKNINFFVDIMKITDEKTGSGSGVGSASVPKCHGSRTLDIPFVLILFDKERGNQG